jgi:hypothetical protein
MSKTGITWTQNVFRYHKVKTNGAKGRLGKTIAAVLFELTAFNFFGKFNIFLHSHKGPNSLLEMGNIRAPITDNMSSVKVEM